MRSAFYFELLAHRAVLIARSARCDVRWVAAVFVEADGTESVAPSSSPADRRREHQESADVVVARKRNDASARSIFIARSVR